MIGERENAIENNSKKASSRRKEEGSARKRKGGLKTSLHLLTFRGIDHSVDHSAMVLSAAWTTEVATPAELDEDQTARSSAKREK